MGWTHPLFLATHELSASDQNWTVWKELVLPHSGLRTSARKIKTLDNGSKKKLPASNRSTTVIIALPNSPSWNCPLWSKLQTKREKLCHRPGRSHAPRER